MLSPPLPPGLCRQARRVLEVDDRERRRLPRAAQRIGIGEAGLQLADPLAFGDDGRLADELAGRCVEDVAALEDDDARLRRDRRVVGEGGRRDRNGNGSGQEFRGHGRHPGGVSARSYRRALFPDVP